MSKEAQKTKAVAEERRLEAERIAQLEQRQPTSHETQPEGGSPDNKG